MELASSTPYLVQSCPRHMLGPRNPLDIHLGPYIDRSIEYGEVFDLQIGQIDGIDHHSTQGPQF